MQRILDFRKAALTSSVLLIFGFIIAFSSCARTGTPDADVWAEVDGQPIRQEEVERLFRQRVATGLDKDNKEQALDAKLNILNELIDNRILVEHADHARVTVSEAEVDTELAKIQSPYSKEEFEKKLSDQGIPPSSFRDQLRQSLIINKLINKEINSQVQVTDAEIADYYGRNKATFNVAEPTYHLAQIAVTPAADRQVLNLKNDDAKTEALAEKKIQALDARLKAGDDFARLAEEYSEDPRTSSEGGDMGFITASSLGSNPTLKQVVTSLKVGQISGIIRTPNGFHIIKLLGKEEPGQRQLSDPRVQIAIRQSLMSEKEQLLKAAYIENLRDHAKVENYLAERIVAAAGNAEAIK